MADGPLTDTGLCNNAALRKATRRMSQLYDLVLAPTGLRATQMSILVHIDRGDAPPMGELANALVLDRSALAHNLKPLERDGLVALIPNPADRRSRLATLTAAGQAKLAECRDLWTHAQSSFEATFGADQAARLRVALSEIASDAFAENFTRLVAQPA
jgi:DNA-binding MarR family transcriptional regulator